MTATATGVDEWGTPMTGSPESVAAWNRARHRFLVFTGDERHTCAFIDLHAAMAFARRPDHPAAPDWLAGIAGAGVGDDSASSAVMREVARPLVDAFVAFGRGDHASCRATIDSLDGQTHRVGGSVAQRDVITLTRRAAAGGDP